MILLIWIGGIVLGFGAVLLLVPGARITSWFRTGTENRRVGGLPLSAHLVGWGWDMIPVTAENERRLKNVFPVVVNEKTHLHVAWFQAPQKV